MAVRNGAYTFDAQPGKTRPKRVENGQTAIVESVDPKRDTLTLLLREPGAQPRLVQVDQARLRAEHAAGKRAAAVRLNYALHTFPAQGATVHGTATLAGNWSQAKQETYVGDTRAVYRHSVHIAREDLGSDGTDEDRIGRYAQRISENRQRHASIRHALDPAAARRRTASPPARPRRHSDPRRAGLMRPVARHVRVYARHVARRRNTAARWRRLTSDRDRQQRPPTAARPSSPQPGHALTDPLIAALGPPPHRSG